MTPGPLADRVRGVVFDMDGTLTESALDFDAIRAEAGVPPGRPILEFMETAPEPVRSRIEKVLDAHERRAAGCCALRDGAAEVLEELRGRGARLALLTRNSAESVRTVLERFGLRFDCCLSREHAEPKPSPQPVLRIAEALGLEPHELLVVGDYVFDMQSGKAAGATTALVRTRKLPVAPREADFVIDDLRELPALLGRAC
jgi:HAD superfamily hydrolase (TIGR01509 family)